MQKQGLKYPDEKATNYVINELQRNGVSIDDIADIAFSYEEKYIPKLTHEAVWNAVDTILHKREVANTAMVALNLDKLDNQYYA